jgi:hypothetical protein
MSTHPARLKRFAVLAAVAGLASVGADLSVAAQGSGQSGSNDGPSQARAASIGSVNAQSGPESVRVYRSVGADGRVTFGDQPVPGARTVEIRSFASSSDAEAMATARSQKQYWREQSEAFDRRRTDREEDERRAALDHLESAPSSLYVIPYHLRPPQARPLPGIPATYGSSPGAAAGVPARFLSSGFASSGR